MKLGAVPYKGDGKQTVDVGGPTTINVDANYYGAALRTEVSGTSTQDITFGDTVNIAANANKDSGFAYAVSTYAGGAPSNLIFEKGLNASVDANSAKGFYVTSKNNGNETITVNGPVQLQVKSDDEASGLYIMSNETTDKNGNVIPGGKVTMNLNDGLDLNVKGAKDKSYGILLYGDQTDASEQHVTVEGDTHLSVNDGTGTAFAANGSNTTLDINKGGGHVVDIKGDGFVSGEAIANIHMDTAGSKVVGDLATTTEGTISLDAVADGTEFIGSTDNLANPQEAPGIINVKLADKGAWRLTDDSKLTNMDMNNGGLVDMTRNSNGKQFQTVTTDNLTGSDGEFLLDIDASRNTDNADRIYVRDTFTGQQYLALNEVGHGDLDITNIDDPTTGTETIAATAALGYYNWINANDTLLKRIGELRQVKPVEDNFWFRAKGTKLSHGGDMYFDNKTTQYDLGYDWVKRNDEEKIQYQGVGLTYLFGHSDYRAGDGKNHGRAISFYNTELNSDGHYLDLVLQLRAMNGEFNVRDTNANHIAGKADTKGIVASAEYGQKHDLGNKWYVEPQGQLTVGYMGSADYTTSNGISVHQSRIPTAIGRVGFNLGRELNENSIVYIKGSVLHEFMGHYDIDMRDGKDHRVEKGNFRDTWFNYGVGLAFATGHNSYFHFDVERTAGGDFDRDWQWNVGGVWTF